MLRPELDGSLTYTTNDSITPEWRPLAGDFTTTRPPSWPYPPYTYVETTTSEDSKRTFIPPIGVGGIVGSPFITDDVFEPSTWVDVLSSDEDEDDEEEEDVPHNTKSSVQVECLNERNLLPDRILKTFVSLKQEFLHKCRDIEDYEIICEMTAKVRDNLLQEFRKLSMYGKKMPKVAWFDEFGRPVSTENDFDLSHKVTVRVYTPEEGEYQYFIAFKSEEISDDDDVPF